MSAALWAGVSFLGMLAWFVVPACATFLLARAMEASAQDRRVVQASREARMRAQRERFNRAA